MGFTVSPRPQSTMGTGRPSGNLHFSFLISHSPNNYFIILLFPLVLQTSHTSSSPLLPKTSSFHSPENRSQQKEIPPSQEHQAAGELHLFPSSHRLEWREGGCFQRLPLSCAPSPALITFSRTLFLKIPFLCSASPSNHIYWNILRNEQILVSPTIKKTQTKNLSLKLLQREPSQIVFIFPFPNSLFSILS